MNIKSIADALDKLIDAVRPKPKTTAKLRGFGVNKRLIINTRNAEQEAVVNMMITKELSITFSVSKDTGSKATLQVRCGDLHSARSFATYATEAEAHAAMAAINRALNPSLWSLAWKLLLALIVYLWLTNPSQPPVKVGQAPAPVPGMYPGQMVPPGMLPPPAMPPQQAQMPQQQPPAPQPQPGAKDAFGLQLPQ